MNYVIGIIALLLVMWFMIKSVDISIKDEK